MSMSLNGSAEVLVLLSELRTPMSDSTYTPAEHSRILQMATRMLQGWGRVPSSYEVTQCLKKAQQLYDESLKVGIPEPNAENSPPIIDLTA